MNMNPKQMVMNYLKNNVKNNNPMLNNLINMANNGDSKNIEQFARNYLQGQGINFDEKMKEFMNSSFMKQFR